MATKLQKKNDSHKHVRSIEDYATVEGYCEKVPVHAFGYTYVYGVSPTLIEGVKWQEGENCKPSKIAPKKSWEIKNNKLGSTPAREPKTAANDDQPLLSLHLIDGDPETCWCSRGQSQPDVEDVWIRIDLPKESEVCSVTLVPSKKGSKLFQSGLGTSYPRNLTLKVSRDAWHWETVKDFTPYEDRGMAQRARVEPITMSFDARPAKQVWIIGSEFPLVWNFGYCFSISGVEVKDAKGNNLALHSKGAGVTVSSTRLGYGMDRFTQDMLWPIQYDLGFKWSRVGYDMSAFQWAYVEREKGKLVVDAKADAAVTEAVENGIEFIMVVDKGNWLYAPEPRHPDRTRQLMETYYNQAPMPMIDKNYMKAWLNYVRFMVRHFKDRVKYFEIWNEFGHIAEAAKDYCKLALPTIEVIREEYPEAKIIPASPGWPPGFIEGCLQEGLGPLIDVIAWHPWYQADPNNPAFRRYPEDVRALKKLAESCGFKGEYMATEWSYFAHYPYSNFADYNFPGRLSNFTEMQKAKYSARLTITHVALDVVSFWNETFQTHITTRDVSLLRNTFTADPITPTQPQPVYYALRTLSTLLEDVKPISLNVEFTNTGEETEWYTLKRGNGEVLLAAWIPGTARDDDSQEVVTDIIFPKAAYKTAVGFDSLNGDERPLTVSQTGGNTVLKGMKIKDCPLIIALR